MKIFIFLLLALFSCTALPAQYDIPTELDIYPESIKIESKYLTYFYPLGFSERDSYFAYVLYENASGGIGYYTYFELNIQNIITDEVELQLIYDGRYRVDPDKGTYPELYKNDPEDEYLEFEVVWRHVLEDVQKALINQLTSLCRDPFLNTPCRTFSVTTADSTAQRNFLEHATSATEPELSKLVQALKFRITEQHPQPKIDQVSLKQ